MTSPFPGQEPNILQVASSVSKYKNQSILEKSARIVVDRESLDYQTQMSTRAPGATHVVDKVRQSQRLMEWRELRMKQQDAAKDYLPGDGTKSMGGIRGAIKAKKFHMTSARRFFAAEPSGTVIRTLNTKPSGFGPARRQHPLTTKNTRYGETPGYINVQQEV